MRTLMASFAVSTTIVISLASPCTGQEVEIPVIQTVIGDGGTEAHDLFVVRDATRFPDGRIAVLDGGSHQLRFFTSEGDYINSVGREGDGPGEFNAPTGVRVLPDGSFLVNDANLARLTHFDPDGRVVNTKRVRGVTETLAFESAAVRPTVEGLVPWIELRPSGFAEARMRDGEWEGQEWILHLLDGEESVWSMTVDRGKRLVVREDGRTMTGAQPYSPSGLFEDSPAGYVLGATHGNEFTVLDREGNVVERLQGDVTPWDVTESDADAWRNEYLERKTELRIRGMTLGSNPARARFAAQATIADIGPAYIELKTGNDGSVWALDGRPGEAADWHQLGENGTLRIVRLDSEWRVFEFGKDYALVSARNEFDEELVLLLSFLQPDLGRGPP